MDLSSVGWVHAPLVLGMALPDLNTGILPIFDWLAVLVLLAGLAFGALSGLARTFGMLLWLLAALWLGAQLAAQFVEWMPNSAKADDPAAVLTAYGLIAAVVLLLPVVARIIGGAAGKKKQGAEVRHKAFGAVTGLLVATLVLTWTAPWVHRFDVLARGWPNGHAPRAALQVADHATYLFPAAHREALRMTIELPAAPATPEDAGK